MMDDFRDLTFPSFGSLGRFEQFVAQNTENCTSEKSRRMDHQTADFAFEPAGVPNDPEYKMLAARSFHRVERGRKIIHQSVDAFPLIEPLGEESDSFWPR